MDESKDFSACNYYHGLRLDMQYLLAFQNFETIDGVVHYVFIVEKVANCRARKVTAVYPTKPSPLKRGLRSWLRWLSLLETLGQ